MMMDGDSRERKEDWVYVIDQNMMLLDDEEQQRLNEKQVNEYEWSKGQLTVVLIEEV